MPKTTKRASYSSNGSISRGHNICPQHSSSRGRVPPKQSHDYWDTQPKTHVPRAEENKCSWADSCRLTRHTQMLSHSTLAPTRYSALEPPRKLSSDRLASCAGAKGAMHTTTAVKRSCTLFVALERINDFINCGKAWKDCVAVEDEPSQGDERKSRDRCHEPERRTIQTQATLTATELKRKGTNRHALQEPNEKAHRHESKTNPRQRQLTRNPRGSEGARHQRRHWQQNSYCAPGPTTEPTTRRARNTTRRTPTDGPRPHTTRNGDKQQQGPRTPHRRVLTVPRNGQNMNRTYKHSTRNLRPAQRTPRRTRRNERTQARTTKGRSRTTRHLRAAAQASPTCRPVNVQTAKKEGTKPAMNVRQNTKQETVHPRHRNPNRPHVPERRRTPRTVRLDRTVRDRNAPPGGGRRNARHEQRGSA